MVSFENTIVSTEYRVTWEVNSDDGWKGMERTFSTPELAELHRQLLSESSRAEYIRNISKVKKRKVTIMFGVWEELPDV